MLLRSRVRDDPLQLDLFANSNRKPDRPALPSTPTPDGNLAGARLPISVIKRETVLQPGVGEGDRGNSGSLNTPFGFPAAHDLTLPPPPPPPSAGHAP